MLQVPVFYKHLPNDYNGSIRVRSVQLGLGLDPAIVSGTGCTMIGSIPLIVRDESIGAIIH